MISLPDMKKRPKDYPLPLNPEGVAYWQINALFCVALPNWQKFQSKKEMRKIIPVIRWLTEKSQ